MSSWLPSWSSAPSAPSGASGASSSSVPPFFAKHREEPLDKRRAAVEKVRRKEKVPVIMAFDQASIDDGLDLKRHKFMPDKECTMALSFLHPTRGILTTHGTRARRPEEAIFICVMVYSEGGKTTSFACPLSQSMETIYADHASDDGALYISLCRENTFGG